MDRKDFLVKTAVCGAAWAVAASPLKLFGSPAPAAKAKSPELKLSFQEGIAPGDSLEAKLDFMEKLGIQGLEPGGGGLASRVSDLTAKLRGRNIKISAICAGFGGFLLAEDAAVRKQCIDSMTEILAAAGELGAAGVILVPAFNGQKPALPHTSETRAFLVEELHKLGEIAAKYRTTVILEPLNRNEAHYLRQVADAASLCRDAKSAGMACMGDFWHMTAEETSDYGAFFSGGPYLKHVHVASRRNRIMPGEDGEADNYIDGFRALKAMNYDGYVSFECGTRGDRAETVTAAVNLLRKQWAEAKA